MQRAGNLIESIAEPDNLRLAFLKASRGKRGKTEVLRFRERLDEQLSALSRELLAGEVDWGGYHTFQVHDPKERFIHAPAFRARVAHHAIMNLCEPAFESYQIFDSYACRKNKGLDAGIDRASKFSRNGVWFLKMDIHKYFDTIDQPILIGQLRRRFKDPTVLRLFESIIGTYETAPGKGVPIGNLTSQFFANHYLGVFDHFVKESLRVEKYVRYMDDFVFWMADRTSLKKLAKTVTEYLAKQLSIEPKAPCLNACRRGLPFLGFRVYPSGLPRLAGRSRQRFRRKLRMYYQWFHDGIWDERELALHAEPLTAFVKRGASLAFRRKTIQNIETQFGDRPEARTG